MKVNISRPTRRGRASFQIKIHEWDVWQCDWTIAVLLLPLLKKVKESKRGVPTSCFEKTDPKDDSWKLAQDRWDRIIDKMIAAMQIIVEGIPGPPGPIHEWAGGKTKKEREKRWEEIIYKNSPLTPEETEKREKAMDYYRDRQNRVNEGCELLGKHMQDLWT